MEAPESLRIMLSKGNSIVTIGFIIYFLIGLLSFADYGVSYDEPISRYNGIISAKYVISKFFPGKERAPEWASIPDLATYQDRDYGVAFELPVFFIEKALVRFASNNPDQFRYLIRHFCTFLVFFTGVFFFYRLAAFHLGNKKWGMLGAGFLVLSPRIYAESFYNDKDIVFLSFFIIATYCLVRYLEQKTVVNACWLGLAAALTVNIRIMGVMHPVVAVGFTALSILKSNDYKMSFRQYFPGMLALMVSFAALTVLFWPYLWEAPLQNFLEAFKNMSRFRWSGGVLYLGTYVSASKIPWHYIPVWIGVTTPIIYTLLFVVGLVIIAWRLMAAGLKVYINSFEERALVFLVLFLGPLLAVIVLQSVLYDGWRQMYFLYGSFLLIALHGLFYLTRWIERVKGSRQTFLKGAMVSLLALSLGVTLFFMVRNHPFQHVFFNILARGTAEKYFERDYWGVSYRQGLEYIVHSDERDPIRIKFLGLPGNANLHLLTDEARSRILFDHYNPDYIVTNYRGVDATALKAAPAKEVHTIYAGSVKILSVYKVQK